jgi:hypothetical protein
LSDWTDSVKRAGAGALALLLLAGPLGAPPVAAEEEAVRVFRLLRPSMVSLKNGEGSGTGVVVDDTGLVLTNAHVVMSPLPFTAEVEAPPGPDGQPSGRALTFERIEVAGFHPHLDLALVRLPATARGVSLTAARLAARAARAGERVYAIGDPGSGEGVLKRTITAGVVSDPDRTLEGQRYVQFTAPINPGNSGGPLVDGTGAILGLVTLKLMTAERVGLALPLAGVDLTAFVPFASRTADPERARTLRANAEKAARIGAGFPAGDERREVLLSLAGMLYRTALTHDPENAEIYHDLGRLLRTSGVKRAPASYLLRGIQAAPWDTDGRAYLDLGLAFLQDGQRAQALTAMQEGQAKHPYASRLHEALAALAMEDRRYADAAYEAMVAARLPGGQERFFELRKVRDAARARLSASEIRDLEQREAGTAEALRTGQAASDAARAARRLYVTPAFVDLVAEMGGPEFPGAAARILPRGQAVGR